MVEEDGKLSKKKPKKQKGTKEYRFPCPFCKKPVIAVVKTEILKKAVAAEKCETVEAKRDTQTRLKER